MKKILFVLVAAFAMATNGWAQYPDPFLTDEERPDGTNWLPFPPSTTSGEFANDFYYYQWGKEQRDEEWVAEWALWDEGVDLSRVYSEVLDIHLSKEETPEILKLAEAATTDAHKANAKVKNYFKRKRPFATFNEPSLKPEEDEEEAKTYSYPSGHSSRGWMYALTLATVAPECTEELMARARIYAIHRVVCGHHWKSDIDASLMLTAGVFAKLVVTEAYQEQLKKAREEYQRIKAATKVNSPAASKVDNSAAIYDMQGRRLDAAPTTQGVYVQNGNKFVVEK